MRTHTSTLRVRDRFTSYGSRWVGLSAFLEGKDLAFLKGYSSTTCAPVLTGTGNRSFSEKTVKKNQLGHKIRTTESDFESFMEDNGRGQWGC